MLRMLLKHLLTKVWMHLLEATVSLQFSDPYSSRDFTFELKILIWVPILRARLLQTGFKIEKACWAFYFLAVMSLYVPPVVWKSTKLMYSRVCNLMVCSIILRKVAIWSTQVLSCLKPACSSLNSLSSSFFILFRIMLQRILLRMDSNIMPLQFLHKDFTSFFGSFTSSPLRQLSGICSSLNILFRSWCRIWIVVSSKH